MAFFLSNRDGGLTDEQGHYRFQTNVWDGNVIGGGLQVTQNSPLGMSVLVGAGDAKVPYGGYAYTAWNDAAVAVTIQTANPSNPRIDRLVLYIDRAETPQQVNPNNPGIPKIMAVAGTPGAVPTRPNNTAVNSAVGATNPWIDLADIRVNAGVTQITNANLTNTSSSAAASALSAQNSYFYAEDPVFYEPISSVGYTTLSGTQGTINLHSSATVEFTLSARLRNTSSFYVSCYIQIDGSVLAQDTRRITYLPMNNAPQVSASTTFAIELSAGNHDVVMVATRAGGTAYVYQPAWHARVYY